MKRTLLSLLFAGMFAAAGTAAMAQNVSPEEQEKAGGQTTNPNAATESNQTAKPDAAADSNQTAKPDAATDSKESEDLTAKADYTAAKAKAEEDYTAAKAKCVDMKGDDKKTCMSDAKSARSEALKMAKAQSTKQQ